MLTYSGISICPDELALPTPQDLAVQMGRITRYGGAIWCPLLFHSLLVARMVADKVDPELDLLRERTITWALFHDAHEIIAGEIPHPWKSKDRAEQERAIDYVFYNQLGFGPAQVDLTALKQCDRAAIYVETQTLGPLSGSESYRNKWDRGFEPGDLEQPFYYANRLRLGNYAEARLCIRADSGPIQRAQRLFQLAYDRRFDRVVTNLLEMTE